MARVAINGLGRIGRATLKILADHNELELIAVNDLGSLDNLVYLLKYDTVYGRYGRDVRAENGKLIVGGAQYLFLSEKDPAQLPWKEHGIDIVFECTGVFTNKEGLEKHLQAGARRAILSAPTKGPEVVTVVYGVNTELGQQNQIMSCASCTTNCITPVVEIMKRRIGVRKAILTTVHAYTSTQAIVDSPSRKYRRGRAGAANFVPTSTGAAVATTKVIPELTGKFDGVAIRGPVPVGSIADMTFVTDRPTSVEELNSIFREEAANDRYRDIVGVSDDDIVSSDIIQDPRASVIDLTMTQVVDGDLVKVMSWYDNEWGYANQMIKQGTAVARSIG